MATSERSFRDRTGDLVESTARKSFPREVWDMWYSFLAEGEKRGLANDGLVVPIGGDRMGDAMRVEYGLGGGDSEFRLEVELWDTGRISVRIESGRAGLNLSMASGGGELIEAYLYSKEWRSELMGRIEVAGSGTILDRSVKITNAMREGADVNSGRVQRELLSAFGSLGKMFDWMKMKCFEG